VLWTSAAGSALQKKVQTGTHKYRFESDVSSTIHQCVGSKSDFVTSSGSIAALDTAVYAELQSSRYCWRHNCSRWHSPTAVWWPSWTVAQLWSLRVKTNSFWSTNSGVKQTMVIIKIVGNAAVSQSARSWLPINDASTVRTLTRGCSLRRWIHLLEQHRVVSINEKTLQRQFMELLERYRVVRHCAFVP